MHQNDRGDLDVGGHKAIIHHFAGRDIVSAVLASCEASSVGRPRDPDPDPHRPAGILSAVTRFWTCYQQDSADPSSGVVAHAVNNENPNVSVANEILIQPVVDEEWPGGGQPCPACRQALTGRP